MSPAEKHYLEPEPPPVRRRASLRLLVAAGVLLVLVLAALGGYLARRDIAKNALVGWLEERGVPAEVEVERFGPTGAVAKIRAGTPGDPEFAVERAEVQYGLLGVWSGDPFGVEVRRVRLVRPVLRGAYKDGKLTFGPLDPVIEEFRRRPPQPDRAKPLVLVEDGLVGLDTQYGLARLRGDARIEDNKLMSLDARLAPAAAKFGQVAVAVRGGEVQLRTRGDRVTFTLGALLEKAEGQGLEAHESFLRLTGEGPYPDLEKRIGDGALALTLAGGARSLDWQGTKLEGAEFNARFSGRTSGWFDTLAIGGRGGIEGKAESLAAGGSLIRAVSFTGEAPTLTWTRTGPDQVGGQGRFAVRAAELAQGELRLQDVIADFRGKASGGEAAPAQLHLTGAVSSNATWTGLGAPTESDDPGLAALKRAARSFSLHAPAVSLDGGEQGLSVALGAPARLTAASGGEAIVSPRAGAPIYEGGRGAFLARTQGSALPKLDLAVDRYALQPAGFTAQGRGRLDGDLLLFRDARLQVAGTLVSQGGALTLTARGCAPIRAATLELGENDVHGFAGTVCATKAPLLTLKNEAWRVRAGLRDASADARFLDLRFVDAAGELDASGSGGPLTLRSTISGARVIDTVAETRFHPVRVSGEAAAARGQWTGSFAVSTPSGHNLGQASLRHDERTERGAFELDTGQVAFAPDGLQPADLSPVARLVASPAEGQARFVGGFSWAGDTGASGGRLSIQRLDFRGPIGPVKGLSGEVELTSLDPLVTPPGQTLTAERIEAFAPLTDVAVTGRIENEALHVARATMTAGRGQVSLEPFTAPFDPKAAWGGAIRLTGVHLSDIVEASPLAEHLDLTAKVDGRVPFRVTGEGVRIASGEIHAVEPGRISIDRDALTQVSADGGAAEAPPNMTVDFAYQAMENLAFSRLAAEIDSRPNGRLGVMFYITGEHDPPKQQELRLSYFDLLGQKFMERTHPLPSGVKVDLALDASLNFDQVMADWAEYQSLINRQSRGSGLVQRTPRN